MSELTTPRLMAAAKEFNIGKETLVDFLVGKGFSRDDLKPTSKLTAEMYRSLQQGFQTDKAVKAKSDQIEIPKGTMVDPAKKKRKEEEEAAARKEAAKPAAKEEVPPPAPAPIAETPVVEKQPAKDAWPPPIQEKPVEAPQPAPPPVVAAPTPPPPPPPVVVAEENNHYPDLHKIEAPELEAPKVITKIDLDALDSSGRPRKTAPKKEEPAIPAEPIAVVEPPVAPVQEVKPQPAPVKTEPAPAPTVVQQQPAQEKPAPAKTKAPAAPAPEAPVAEKPAPVVEAPVARKPTPEVKAPVVHNEPISIEADKVTPVQESGDQNPEIVITNIKAERLEGPKILGKIELPVSSDTRPKPNEEKRKRKRIPLDKKGEQPNQQHAPNRGDQPHRTPDNRGGGQGANREGRPPFGGGNNNNNAHAATPPNNQNRGPARTPVQNPGGNRSGGGGGFNRGGGGQNRGGGGAGFNRGGQGGGNGRFARPGDRPANSNEPREINSKEIQDKIRETQARLAGSTGRGKSLKAKYRKAKRGEMSDHMGEDGGDNKLQVTEFISVAEFANLMDVSFADVISKCMGLGIMVSINQRLDAEVIELVAGEFGYEVEFIDMKEEDDFQTEEEEDAPEDLQPRAPIVTIMGHVDHGKTSLLDYVRKANVVAGEAGGITQHIGAYQVTTGTGKKITFLDTPGHEAFTAMRARGAKAADVTVIVVAADDAVMPQTKEAISHAQAANLPMVFAINKVDKDGANPEKIKEQLAGMNILVEDWGGKFQSQEISAKAGLNIDLLLEKILLEAELLDLKANPDRNAIGTIVEASLDKGRGYIATVLVETGTLKQGDIIVVGQNYGRIKAMFNERNQRVEEAGPSSAVQILGLNGAPQAGEKFKVFDDESEAKDIATRRAQILREQGMRAKKHITLDEIGRRLALGNFKELNMIIKGDVDGSVEALSDSLQKLSTEEILVKVVHKGVGQITESDVLLAAASDAIIVGFNVRPSMQANKLAENEGVQIKHYSIIYDVIDEVKSAMEGMLEPKIQEKITANVEVREMYKFDKMSVAGCYVLDGKIFRNNKIRVVRDGIVVHTGELGSLKRYKDDAKEVQAGMECGLTVKNFSDNLKVGDIIESYEEVEVKRTL